MANAIRFLAADAVEAAKSGHPGLPLGFADVATVLFTRFLTFDPALPQWPDRDRLVLSAGHGSALLYAAYHLLGYLEFGIDQIRAFRQLDSNTPGHPEVGIGPIETTTGPLGQGLANAVGMALAERMLAARFGAGVVDHRTYVMVGDGCLMEGISHEAISLAGHLRLGKLIVLWDDNGITIDGGTALSVSDDQKRRFEACGWDVQAVDGHDSEAIAAALTAAQSTPTPSLIACRTTIGYGAPTKAGKESVHGAPLGEKELTGMRAALGWTAAPFEVPDNILAAWRQAGARGHSVREAWEQRYQATASEQQAEFERRLGGHLPEGWAAAITAFKREIATSQPKVATRKASQDALTVLTGEIPELVGGSADLSHSNLTLTKHTKPISREDFGGSYVFYGIREFAMAAVMNGLALHGGFIPYGGTFLVFADYMRNGIRMAALMEQRVIFVLTHDSIGVGEDGPTHQPIEHLAMLRATPNLRLFRPADAVETAEAWSLALADQRHPSALALSRQALPTVRTTHTDENLTARGGYVLREATAGLRRVTLIATGSEVALACTVRDRLEAEGVGTAVVSLPCWELFDDQPASYRREVLGDGTLKVAIEAASSFGWHKYVGTDGIVIGLDRFGQSAPAEALFKRFGFTPEAVLAVVKGRV